MNDPKKFWKLIKSTAGDITPPTLPECLKINQNDVKGKQNIVDAFNKHFIDAGVLAQSSVTRAHGGYPNPTFNSPNAHGGGPISTYNSPEIFNFSCISTSQVHKALLNLDCKKSAGPDQIEPYFLKSAAGLIAGFIATIFNLSLYSGEIPNSWKSAFVLPLLKGGDPSCLDNYRPISRLSVNAKLFESIINEQVKFIRQKFCLPISLVLDRVIVQ